MTQEKEFSDNPHVIDFNGKKDACEDIPAQNIKEEIFESCDEIEPGFIGQEHAVGGCGERISQGWAVKEEKFEEIFLKEEREEDLEDQSCISDENEERLDSQEENKGNVTSQTVVENCLQQEIECPPANFVVDGLLQSNSESSPCDGREKLKKKRRTIGKHYKCSFCSYKATQMGHLKRHERTHSGEKPFKCDACPYKAALMRTLKQHERTHIGEKPFKCTTCPYKASQKGNLEKHERTHTGEKPFKCSTCPYKATIVWNLKQHERTHIGEKPFKCSTCPYKASQMGNLKRHERTHNGDSESTQRVPRVAKHRLRTTLSSHQEDKDPKATTSE